MKCHLLTLIITFAATTSLHNTRKVSPWSEWSKCSRTCGVGVQSRARSCLMGRGPHGGSPCGVDATEEYRLCNQDACPPRSRSFRSIQCAAYNNRQVAGRYVKRWIPLEGHWGCELKCKSVDHGATYSFGKAENGTRCSPEGGEICVHGRCTVIGCDDILGSTKNLDICGLCGGHNDTCKRMSNTFTEPRPTTGDRIRRVVTIPAGSTHIRILDSTASRLVVQDVHGSNVLNREKHYSWPGIYPIAGSQMEYRFTWNNETITINGPTNQNLHLMVRYGIDEWAKVIYEFYQPIKNISPTTPPPPIEAEVSTRSSARNYRGSRENRKSDHRGKTNTKQRQLVTEKKIARLANDRKASRQYKNRTRSSASQRRKHCPPCKKVKNLQQHFCDSDFVINAKVKSHQVLGGEIRYELRVLRSYKNLVNLGSQEYIWASDGKCRCPRLRLHREYIIMGFFDPAYSKRESRLVVDERSFVRRLNDRNEKALLITQQRRNCNRIA